MSAIIRLAAFITLFVAPAAMANESPHCVTGKSGFGATITQCDDGTVTVATGRKEIVCTKGDGGGHTCTEVGL